MIAKVSELVGDFIYSYDDEELNEVVVRLLREKHLTLASAESCTGGQFAASITDVPGASNVIGASYVTYSSAAKVSILGVSQETIDRCGVVSAEVAKEMADGARRLSGADIGISVTGFAGPDADEGHNAGEAYIGYSISPSLAAGISGAGEERILGDDGSLVGSDYVNTSRNLRKWNRNYFRLRMLRRVYEIIK